jgi:hypothetical protein
MNFTPQQRTARGRITNARTANFVEFLYNPTKISDKKGVNLSEDLIPGFATPLIHYASGKTRVISFSLFLCGESSLRFRGVNLLNGARPEPVEKALDYPITGELDFFRSFEYPVDPSLPGSDGGVDKVLLTYGPRYQALKCIMESADIEETEWNPKAEPTRATISFVFKVPSDAQEYANSIWKPPLEGFAE